MEKLAIAFMCNFAIKLLANFLLSVFC